MSYFLIIVGMIGAIIGQKYAPANVHQKDWLENCPSGYESECKVSFQNVNYSSCPLASYK
jgi:hypothetical protein